MGILHDLKECIDAVRKLRRIADDYTDIICCNANCANHCIDAASCLLKCIRMDKNGACMDCVPKRAARGPWDDIDDGK